MRSILLFNTKTNRTEELTNLTVSTWGELKAHLAGRNLITDDMKAVIRENKNTLESNDAQLPSGLGRDANQQPNGYDFTLLLLPTKVKSGNETTDSAVDTLIEFLDEIDELTNNFRTEMMEKLEGLAKTNLSATDKALFDDAMRLRRELGSQD